MKWRRWITPGFFLLAWFVIVCWQVSEYDHARRLALTDLDRQGRTINRALIGGIRTHRGMGRFFLDNIRQALDDVVASHGVVAASIEVIGGQRVAVSGEASLISREEQSLWSDGLYRLYDDFRLPFSEPGGADGRGYGPRYEFHDQGGGLDRMVLAGTLRSTLVLDGRATLARCRREAWLRSFVVLASTLVLASAGLLWRTSIRAAETRWQARLLESESQYFRDLSHAAAGLAHETRNPLGVIRGWAQRLAGECDRDELADTFRSMVEECDRVTARINQFLSFARPPEPQIAEFSLAEQLAELASLLEPLLDEKDLELRLDAVRPEDIIADDREMFRQVMFNLLQNAIEFSPRGEVVEVGVHRTAGQVRRIDVLDRGPGVPEDKVDSVFSPYFTSRPGGTGLGLAIVRRIAIAHGWHAGYEPRSQGGAVFWLDLSHG